MRAQAAARALRTMSTAKKNRALREMAKAILAHRAQIESANVKDLAADLPDAKKDRLRIDVDAVARGLRDVAGLPDPVGRVEKRRPKGRFRLFRVRVPIGVVLFVYEARPSVTAEAAALCLKSGNAAILKGGSEARHTNAALFEAMKGAIPDGAIQLVTGGHDEVSALLAMDDWIDLVIPRGGEGLIRRGRRADEDPGPQALPGELPRLRGPPRGPRRWPSGSSRTRSASGPRHATRRRR